MWIFPLFEILPQISLAWIKMSWCLSIPQHPCLSSLAASGREPTAPCSPVPLFSHLPFLPSTVSLSSFPEFQR